MGTRRASTRARLGERAPIELVALVLALVPVGAAFVRSVATRWMPIGDNALVEIRSRDVFTVDHFPLLGTWSSASRAAGKDLNHPGPLLFDLLAVPVKLFGGSVGVALGVSLINAAAIVGVVLVSRRIGGVTSSLAASVVAGAFAWTLGSEMLISPWNPHVLMFPALCLLVLVWGVATGDLALVPWMLAVGSLCVQTHVGYGYLVPAVCLLALGGAAVTLRTRWRTQGPTQGPTQWRTDVGDRDADLRHLRRVGVIAVATGLVLWAQPIWEQLTGPGEGNLGRLVTSSGGDEDAIGLSLGARIVGGIVALPPWWTRPSFVDAIPFTPYDPDGVLRPQGLPSVGASLLGLVVVLALLGWCVVASRRRDDRVALVAAGVAATVVIVALAMFAIVPVGTLGLTAHQMRWVWSLGAFVTLVLLVNAVRTSAASASRVRALVSVAAVALTAAFAILAVPAHVHRDGPSAAPEAQGPSRDLSSQIDDWEAPAGGVVFETGNLRFSEPYSTVVMSALQRNAIDFFVEDHGLIRQFGEDRRFDGTARLRMFLLEDRAALDEQPGATLVARATPLTGAEIAELVAGERELVARITAKGLVVTPEGAASIESGGLGVTLTEVDAAAFDAQRLVADGAIARLTRAGVLDIAPDDLGLFRRNAELRAQVDLRTVAVFVVPEP